MCTISVVHSAAGRPSRAHTTWTREAPTMAQATTMAHAMKTTLRPLHDRVLVKRLEVQDEKHGSLIIPDTAKEKPQEGKVVPAGTGKVNDDGKNSPRAVREGDRILSGEYSCSEVKLDGEKDLLMMDEHVLGSLP